MLWAIGIMWDCLWLSSDDISDHQKRRKILIMKLRHGHALLLTRPAVSSRGGLKKAAEIEPTLDNTWSLMLAVMIMVKHYRDPSSINV